MSNTNSANTQVEPAEPAEPVEPMEPLQPADPLARPLLRRQQAIYIEHDRTEEADAAEQHRRSTRHVIRPQRLLDELLLTESVQEFYYEGDPSDLDESDLDCTSDEEWLAQVARDAEEEDEGNLTDDLDNFIVYDGCDECDYNDHLVDYIPLASDDPDNPDADDSGGEIV